MFKNLIVYAAIGCANDLQAAEAALAPQAFAPCGQSQQKSAGWVPPRGEDGGPLIESIGGQWVLALKVETKMLPASVVKRRAEQIAKAIEKDTGRKPGKKQSKEIKEQATFELLPQAFTRETVLRVWIDPQAGTLAIGASGAKAAEEVVSLLVKALSGLVVSCIETNLSPAKEMGEWIATGEAPACFTIDQDCELRDGSKAAVRYARHALDTDDVRHHIEAGKQPTRLAMTWRGRVSFVLTDALTIKRLAFDTDQSADHCHSAEDAFDADVAIATGELRLMLPELFEALGGRKEACRQKDESELQED